MPKIKREILHFETSMELCDHVKENHGPDVLLSFSGGKDSIGCWLRLAEVFGPEHVHPVFMYLVPNLEFVEQGIRYYEEAFGKHILRLPHPSLYRFMDELIYQSPGNATVIEQATIPTFDYDFVFSAAKHVYGLDQDTYTAVGVRARDNLNRWASIKQWGAINLDRLTFYPVFDWDKDELLGAITGSGLQLPVDYRMFGRSYDGLDWRFTREIKEHYPNDYKTLLEWFPMIPAEEMKHEARARYLDKGGYPWVSQT